MSKRFLVFEEHPYEGYWISRFSSEEEAKEYALSLRGNLDVTDVVICIQI